MLQNIPKEKILEVVRLGPTLPAKVAKAIGGGADTMLIGAMLSSLISTGEVFVSTLKVGGSPLYYLPEHESKLEEFISYLNEKDRRTFALLKEKKVLSDSSIDPLTRVSLRTIKDFAKPMEVDVSGQKLLFWRFYSVSRDDALVLARDSLKNVSEQAPSKEPVVEKPLVSPAVKTPIAMPETSRETLPQASQQVLEPVAKDMKHEEKKHATHAAHKHKESHKEVQTEDVSSEVPAPNLFSTTHSEQSHKAHEHHKIEHVETTTIEPITPRTEDVKKEPKVAKIKEPKVPKEKPVKVEKKDYDFYALILEHISKKKLDLISKEKIKKSEYNIILKNHDNNEYIYCKAKDKSSINEGDLAPALIFAQNKKMPCLFLSTGNLSKSAESMIGKEFSSMTFEKIESVHPSQPAGASN